MPNKVFLPPVEYCLGTKPSQADNCLEFSKLLMSPIDDTKAVAVITPIPGIVCNRLQSTLLTLIVIRRFS